MRHSEGRVGRVFVIRLEDGEIVPDAIEGFAVEHGVKVAHAIIVGGIGSGEVVVGPRDSDSRPPDPMLLPLDGTHEVAGVGVLAPDEEGRPVLHMHAALGRSGRTTTGCLREGVKTWVMCEVILYEIIDAEAVRRKDPDTGFIALEPGGGG
jgi:predicted DNA-binding protein with PD1-like motif